MLNSIIMLFTWCLHDDSGENLQYMFTILLTIKHFEALFFLLLRLHVIYTSLQPGVSICLCWQSSKEQPGFDFPTDLPVRGVVPSTQRFGTVTMLAQTQAEHPPPLFPGPWQCNTLRTKSHFPFLSNFHTPAPLLPRLACPLKRGLWWQAYDSFHLPYFSHHSLECFNVNSFFFSYIRVADLFNQTFSSFIEHFKGISNFQNWSAMTLIKTMKNSGKKCRPFHC